MKSDLDSLMQDRGLDAILVTGPGQHNPYMVYLTGGGHLTHADLVKLRGAEPILFHAAMERDEAAKTGLRTKNLADYRPLEVLKQVNGDLLQASVRRYQAMFADIGLTQGRVALYGRTEAGQAFALFSALQAALPGITFTGELDDSALLQAMATKDAAEVERIRRMGRITVGVVGQVAEFLSSQRVENDTLVGADDRPVTVGEVKSRINLWLAERGAENPEGTIFAIGRDAGVPHSTGTATDVLRLGQTIVFDIFPCEAGGGYFYDLTRTWCLGYAPDEAMQLWEQVYAVYTQIQSELKPGARCRDYQFRTCELFEAQGHPTLRTDETTQTGYVHSLGHGVGLNIHERPWFSMRATSEDVLAPGAVITVEPGLYYPERGLGMRLEDTVWVNPAGGVEVLAEYPLDLVLPVRN
jgi:Xaa-Pro aminopeptidase